MKDYLKYFIFRYVSSLFRFIFHLSFHYAHYCFYHYDNPCCIIYLLSEKKKSSLSSSISNPINNHPYHFSLLKPLSVYYLKDIFLLSYGIITTYSIFPFALFLLLCSLTAHYQLMIFGPILLLFIQLVSLYVFSQDQIPIKKYIVKILCLVLLCTTSFYVYQTSPARKYSGGHGFDYMNGYSSTDLSPFYPYTEDSQLVELQEPSTFTIENEKDMPVLDGAEACYPVYSAIAKAVYKDIDQIEKAYSESEDYNYYNTNGKIVTFTNTICWLYPFNQWEY